MKTLKLLAPEISENQKKLILRELLDGVPSKRTVDKTTYLDSITLPSQVAGTTWNYAIEEVEKVIKLFIGVE